MCVVCVCGVCWGWVLACVSFVFGGCAWCVGMWDSVCVVWCVYVAFVCGVCGLSVTSVCCVFVWCACIVGVCGVFVGVVLWYVCGVFFVCECGEYG